MKSLNNYKEIPIDVAVLTFYKLSSYYINEIRRGFCNKGKKIFKKKNLYLIFSFFKRKLFIKAIVQSIAEA